MSSNIHPHWYTTDDEEIVPVRAAPKRDIPIHTTNVSRRPAAIVGILLVVGLTTLFYQGVQNLTGQLADTLQIHITDTGFQPQDITAAPGQKISWINERQTPQYIISNTLCTATGDCLNTPTMFQDDRANYTIPTDSANGTYTYFSPTDPNLTGTITVTGSASPADQSTPASSNPLGLPDFGDAESVDAFTFTQQSLLESIQRQLALDQESQQQTVQQEPESEQPAPQSGIPKNPHTVGSSRALPFDAEGNSVLSSFSDAEPPSTLASIDNTLPTFAGNVQKPFRQPQTGPGIWIVLILSTLSLLYCARRAAPVNRLP